MTERPGPLCVFSLKRLVTTLTHFFFNKIRNNYHLPSEVSSPRRSVPKKQTDVSEHNSTNIFFFVKFIPLWYVVLKVDIRIAVSHNKINKTHRILF